MLSIWVPVAFFLLTIVAFAISFAVVGKYRSGPRVVAGALFVFTVVTFILAMVVSIPPGHAGVAIFFGEVQKESRGPGIHFENPLLDWKLYDCRQKSHKETAGVPSKDQLITNIDVSVQYRIDPKATPRVLDETGTANDMLMVHLVPKLRSLLREAGKTVEKAEDFYLDKTQARLQIMLREGLITFLEPKGMEVSDVLLRDIVLPPTIRDGVIEKKKRDQEAEKQKAELRRFETEQQQKVAQAQAELDASKKQAEQKRVLADAQAYEIEHINKAIAQNPAYIQLEALKALQAISKDPAAKIYFLNADSPAPLPLMHMGDQLKIKMQK